MKSGGIGIAGFSGTKATMASTLIVLLLIVQLPRVSDDPGSRFIFETDSSLLKSEELRNADLDPVVLDILIEPAPQIQQGLGYGPNFNLIYAADVESAPYPGIRAPPHHG